MENKKRKWLVPASAAAAVLIICCFLAFLFVPTLPPFLEYSRAKFFIKAGNFNKAYTVLSELYDYKDSKNLLQNFKYFPKTETQFNQNGEKIATIVIKYDRGERKLTKTSFDPDQKVKEKEIINYNKDGSENEIFSRYDNDMKLTAQYKYSYDDDRISSCRYYYDSLKNLEATYSYYDNGKLKNIYWYENNGSISIKQEYNTDGKLTTTIYCSGKNETTKYQYDYDKKGNLILEEKYSYSSLYSKIVHEYDEQGIRVSSTIYDKDGNKTGFSEYEGFIAIYFK